MTRTVVLPPETGLRADGTKSGGWWHETDEPGRIVCDLCPRECIMKPGDRGFCFVRQNLDGEMVLTTYGRSTGFCVDPIEKKPLNHFLPGTSILSFGTAGCNLGCKFCQNWDISKSREVERLSEMATPEMIAQAAHSLACRSVAFTYNDPVIWAEYAIDTARACRAVGIKTVAVTAGYITPEARGPFYEAMDAANVDLKAFTEDFYWKLTSSHIEPVLETLEWLKRETDVWFEITNLVIPQANDSMDEIRRMSEWILERVGDDVPVHFTAFHPDFRMTDRPRTPHETLLAARQAALEAGIRYAYVGNVNDAVHQSTYCPQCRGLLIERNWYELGAYQLRGSQCGHCGGAISGRFEQAPGTWGRKRLPIRISQFARSEPAGSENSAGSVTPKRNGGATMSTAPTAGTPNPGGAGADEGADEGADRGAAAGTAGTEAPELGEVQERSIHRAACETILAEVHGLPAQWSDPSLGGAATSIVMGAFVTVKRQGRLRGCCGSLGQPVAIKDALLNAALRTATQDVRLPPISPTELSYVDVDISLLYGFLPLKTQGRDRIGEVVVGRHGLQIQRGDQGGLLLPVVATENGWDSEEFLQQVCRKAGLPTTAWTDDNAVIRSFEGYSIPGTFDQDLLVNGKDRARSMFEDAEVQRLAQHARNNVIALVQGATPSYYITDCSDGTVQGLVLSVHRMGGADAQHLTRISMRPGMPLQATLFNMVESVANSLRNERIGMQGLQGIQLGVSVLGDAAMHGTVADADLGGIVPGDRSILITENVKTGLCYDPQQTPQGLLDLACKQAQVSSPGTAAIYSLSVQTSESSIAMSTVPRPAAGPQVRPPAVAGTFYPADADELSAMLDRCLENRMQRPKAWPAVMVPHAGLRFSGHIAGNVFGRVKIPETVIVIGPKHTRLGVEWAVAPNETWSLPGATLASDPELARQLAAGIPGLQLDAMAHQQEHGVEVELPFLARLAPQTRVVGIAIGAGDLGRCQQFAAGLAQVLDGMKSPPLLVISSDMNHFANDDETRKLDRMAIDALGRLNPEDVLQTVRKHNISMCGVLPAVIVLETLQKMGRLQKSEEVAYGTSGDVSEDKSRVVGYSGMLFG